MRWLVVVALLVVSNAATFYVTMKNARPKRHSVESVLAEANSSSGIVIIGDSLVEDAKFPPSVCGIPITNAGIGGAKTSTLLAIAQNMVAKPSLVVVSVGVNDAPDANFRTLYSLLLESLPKTKIATASLAQIGSDEINRTIREISERHGAHVIDMSTIEHFETRDGIHPTERSYPQWRHRLLDGIRGAISCDD